ncbi:putative Zn(II)2Cys6 transcription factor [Microthyrium microscopicum]|uniref:Putative Zn(II)2Cys6 transcription factor n=1 Tax=Microthyrium microscopicum TaxID=703497 RepID=A0A6A6U790_9PEZI|nr:putative Zn(II)2Cys6 transcription factor [Microthyrium microscopicum]
MTAHAGEAIARRRKVRKGTHSCWECRNRKVKCNFALHHDVCIPCRRRGTKCVSQIVVIGGPETNENNTVNSNQTRAPISGNSIAERPVPSKDIQALLKALPCRKDLEILHSKLVRFTWYCYRSTFKPGRQEEIPDEEFRITNLLRPESHQILLARQMLLFASALQYVSPNTVLPGLSKHHHIIMHELADSAIQRVTSNDLLLGVLENLQNIILEGFYHIDGGNIRRAWITMRRAVMAAQLLGLHRPGHYRFKVINAKDDLDPETMWSCIVCMERILSLLLGLPTSTGEAVDGTRTYNIGTLVNVTAKIIDRNQIDSSQRALDITRKIDRELIEMAENWPSTFWRPLSFVGLDIESLDAFQEIKRARDHMLYYTLITQLHLPYMLSSSHALQRVYSKIACVNASREILAREIAIREYNPYGAVCRMGDFMALIAGMSLILAHTVSHCPEDRDNLLVHQRLGDRAIVERALECMTSMSELHKDVLAAKCAGLLKDLLAAEANAAEGYSSRTQSLQEASANLEDDQKVLIINVPYIGALRIAREGITTLESVETEQEHAESVTIGGIGSIHIKNPRDDNRQPINALSEAVIEASTTMAAPRAQEDLSHVAEAELEDFFVQPDPIFPDAAASMDNWVFQGLDTAFFDTLMNGVGNTQITGSNAENWDFSTLS